MLWKRTRWILFVLLCILAAVTVMATGLFQLICSSRDKAGAICVVWYGPRVYKQELFQSFSRPVWCKIMFPAGKVFWIYTEGNPGPIRWNRCPYCGG